MDDSLLPFTSLRENLIQAYLDFSYFRTTEQKLLRLCARCHPQTHEIPFERAIYFINKPAFDEIFTQKTGIAVKFLLHMPISLMHFYFSDKSVFLILSLIRRIMDGDTESSSNPIRRNVSVSVSSAPSSPQMPTQHPSLCPLSTTIFNIRRTASWCES